MYNESSVPPENHDKIRFTPSARPVATIVILAWRLTDVLLDCLRSLRASQDAPSYEVRIVLNGATDEVRDALANQVDGATFIDLAANIGFGGGCNAGARDARGTYLIFLNDDTLVASDWLSRIVTFASSQGPALGAVASILLNGDGTVQEAGSRVLRDAGTLQFGKGLSLADARQAGLVSERPIDYGSGAALLVDRVVFEELEGFDPSFEPAYYEDVDLCFRIQHSGRTVRLCPDAFVVHLSGESTKNDRYFRDFASRRSGDRFIARWSAVLAEAPERTDPVDEICDPRLLTAGLSRWVQHGSDPMSIALDISRDYAGWLAAQLKALEVESAVTASALAVEAQQRAVLADRAARLEERLHDLDHRGPIGIAKWKAGILVDWWRRRRQLSRS